MAGTRVKRDALRRAWSKGSKSGRGVWVQVDGLTPPPDDATAMNIVRRAQSRPGFTPSQTGQPVVLSLPAADAGFAVFFDAASPQADQEALVDSIAQMLGDEGQSAHIHLATARMPPWLGSYEPPIRRLTLFASATLADPRYGILPSDGTWGVPPEATVALLEDARDWVESSQGERRIRVELQNASVATFANASGLALESLAAGLTPVCLSRSTVHPASSNEVHFGSQGMISMQTAREPRDWHSEYAGLRDRMLHNAWLFDVAFVREAVGGSLHGWSDLTGSVPALPNLEEWHIRYNQPLLSQFVPDANVLQVLTRDHLDKAADLDDWRVARLDGERFLVEAPDPGEWLAGTGPNPEVVSAARANFGRMILTPDFAESERLRRLQGRAAGSA